MSLHDASMIATPMLEKRRKVIPVANEIGSFMDWLRDEKHVILAQWGEDEDRLPGHRKYGTKDKLLPAQLPRMEQLLAEFFGIDLNQIDREQEALLEEIRK